MKNRRSYTQAEAVQTLQEWISRKHGGNRAAFVRWLEEHGITITGTYLRDMLTDKRPPGPKFREVFHEITGITLVDGLVEDK